MDSIDIESSDRMGISGASLAKTYIKALLFICFTVHIWGMMSKYFARKSMTVEEKLEVEETPLPRLTLCRKKPYREEGFFYNESAFEEMAVTFDELFDGSAEALFAEQGIEVAELKSQVRGRCFTLFTTRIFRSGDVLQLPLNSEMEELLVYLHQAGEEFWMNIDYWPGEVSLEELEEPTHCTIWRKVTLDLYSIFSTIYST